MATSDDRPAAPRALPTAGAPARADEGLVRLQPMPGPWSDLWLWWLDLDQPLSAAAASALTPPERERAARFHFARDRHRFQVGRAALRQQLGAALGRPAREVGLVVQTHGKPALADAPDGTDWQFNLSHSGSVGLFGLTQGRPLGVDVECPRPMDDLAAIARTVFTAAEQRTLHEAPPERRLAVFLNVWTRKEACLKAWGTGLSLPAQSFEAGAGPGEAWVWPPDPALGGALCVRSIAVPDNPGCEAAVALGTAGGTRRPVDHAEQA